MGKFGSKKLPMWFGYLPSSHTHNGTSKLIEQKYLNPEPLNGTNHFLCGHHLALLTGAICPPDGLSMCVLPPTGLPVGKPYATKNVAPPITPRKPLVMSPPRASKAMSARFVTFEMPKGGVVQTYRSEAQRAWQNQAAKDLLQF